MKRRLAIATPVMGAIMRASAGAFAGAFAGVLAAAAVATAQAAPSPQAQREIAALIEALGASGCEFERNGRWYEAKTAKAHLQKKYDYLRRRGLADTAELFIERAASESSMSGKPYRVRCPGADVEASRRWFERRLRGLRDSARPTASDRP